MEDINTAGKIETNSERKKVLYVDDVQVQLFSLRERLREQYEVIPANSVEEMFKILEKIKPHIILLDINMPGINGFAAIEKLRQNEDLAPIPVIFLSALNKKSHIVKGMQLGAADFIKKPFKVSDLFESIQYQLSPAARSQNKAVILAVDDSPSILSGVKELLGEEYKVYTLTNPEKIESILDIVVPDLFLLDCKMPVLSGFDLVPIIRKHRFHSSTPIMFLTSEQSVDTVTVALNMGACDYILKPIDETVLRSKISKHISGFFIRRRLRDTD